MYRKEQCRSLLDTADGNDVNLEKKPETKWHKVSSFLGETTSTQVNLLSAEIWWINVKYLPM